MLISNRANTILLALILAAGIGIIAMLASGVRGGPLDPPGPPASTMHTLADTPPSWDQVLDSTNGSTGGLPGQLPNGCNSDRFKCVMNYTQCASVCFAVYPAVLDEETGLVWQRAPSTILADWTGAQFECEVSASGRRRGWRLPTWAELNTLHDPGGAMDPALPSGSPFSVSAGQVFWTSTVVSPASNSVYVQQVTPGFAVGGQPVTGTENYWCVRGATGDR